jgi:hypothetical protein
LKLDLRMVLKRLVRPEKRRDEVSVTSKSWEECVRITLGWWTGAWCAA